mmetsp:Transcript_42861/g.99569  ORF Transcript_42861/g.99569 Transcript_42861/m.99569 type:complete len:208 (-) Transcript_42861:408-1031(-)
MVSPIADSVAVSSSKSCSLAERKKVKPAQVSAMTLEMEETTEVCLPSSSSSSSVVWPERASSSSSHENMVMPPHESAATFLAVFTGLAGAKRDSPAHDSATSSTSFSTRAWPFEGNSDMPMALSTSGSSVPSSRLSRRSCTFSYMQLESTWVSPTQVKVKAPPASETTVPVCVSALYASSESAEKRPSSSTADTEGGTRAESTVRER